MGVNVAVRDHMLPINIVEVMPHITPRRLNMMTGQAPEAQEEKGTDQEREAKRAKNMAIMKPKSH